MRGSPGIAPAPKGDFDSAPVRAQAAQAARPISESEENLIGRAVAARILGAYPLEQNEAATLYVNTVGQILALNSPRPQTLGGYHFAILDTPEANAFACPGGIVLLTRGLVKLCANEDELAAVLAHEVAHLVHRDGVKSIQRSRWAEVLASAGATRVKQRGQAAADLVSHFDGSIGDIFQALVVNGYGRKAEERADLEALQIMLKAGYNPGALVAVLTKMAAAEKRERGMARTHPPAGLRLTIAQGQVPSSSTTEMEKTRTQRFQEYKF
jgi:beta-barrel assembly-enhancing protease